MERFKSWIKEQGLDNLAMLSAFFFFLGLSFGYFYRFKTITDLNDRKECIMNIKQASDILVVLPNDVKDHTICVPFEKQGDYWIISNRASLDQKL